MSNLKLTPDEYKRIIKMDTPNKYLLVEGKQDKQFFRLFLYEFSPEIQIVIDSAEKFVSFDNTFGKRQIVEKISELIAEKSYAHRFVGFVDREYREFDLELLADRLNCHRLKERLVWSRGHSIENYFFDYQIIHDSLLGLSSVECFDKAIKDFEKCFEKTIRIACALGLTGFEMGKSDIIRNSIHSNLFNIQNSEIILQVEKWENSLKTKKFTDEEVLIAVNSFQSWLSKLTSVSFESVRWLCDGHSGIEIIWAVYHRCVFTNTSENFGNEADKIYKVPEDARFQTLASWLFRKAKTKESIYPYAVLNLLGVDLC